MSTDKFSVSYDSVFKKWASVLQKRVVKGICTIYWLFMYEKMLDGSRLFFNLPEELSLGHTWPFNFITHTCYCRCGYQFCLYSAANISVVRCFIIRARLCYIVYFTIPTLVSFLFLPFLIYLLFLLFWNFNSMKMSQPVSTAACIIRSFCYEKRPLLNPSSNFLDFFCRAFLEWVETAAFLAVSGTKERTEITASVRNSVQR